MNMQVVKQRLPHITITNVFLYTYFFEELKK